MLAYDWIVLGTVWFFAYQTLPKYQCRTANSLLSWYYRKLYGYLNPPCLAYIYSIKMHKNMLAYDWIVLGTVWIIHVPNLT